MSSMMDRVMKALQEDKKKYIYIFHDLKKKKLVLIKGLCTLLPGPRNPKKRDFYDYADEHIFGLHIWADKIDHWEYIGKL